MHPAFRIGHGHIFQVSLRESEVWIIMPVKFAYFTSRCESSGYPYGGHLIDPVYAPFSIHWFSLLMVPTMVVRLKRRRDNLPAPATPYFPPGRGRTVRRVGPV